jgi:hypothetical protein
MRRTEDCEWRSTSIGYDRDRDPHHNDLPEKSGKALIVQ